MANKYGDVTFISAAEYVSPTALMLSSSGVFAVDGDITRLYVSDGKRLVGAAGDPGVQLQGRLVVGATLYPSVGQDWTVTGYQIYRNGTAISGATGPYVVQAADVVPGTVLTLGASGLMRMSRPLVAAIVAPDPVTGLVLTAMSGAVSAAFTVPANTGGAPLAAVTVTLSNGLVGTGLTSPIVIQTPNGTAVNATATATNTAGMTSDPSATSNTVTPVASTVPATAVTLTGPTTSTAGSASSAYTVALSPTGGTVATPVTVTPIPVTGVTFAPTSVSLTTASPSATFTATVAAAGTVQVAVTNNGGLTNPAAISLVASASAAPVGGNFSTQRASNGNAIFA